MTRLNRIIKAFNDYDNFIKKYSTVRILGNNNLDYTKLDEYVELTNIRNEVSLLIGELKEHGCRREN